MGRWRHRQIRDAAQLGSGAMPAAASRPSAERSGRESQSRDREGTVQEVFNKRVAASLERFRRGFPDREIVARRRENYNEWPASQTA